MTTSGSPSKTTKDHDTIKKWVEERKGLPATVISDDNKNRIGILRIMFPASGPNKNLREISWEEFFEQFDKQKLQLLYQDKTADGKLSRFFKFVRI